MVKLENISFSYNKKQEFIKDLSLEFKSGEVTTILGPNGSGKSTLLHMISTYLKPKSGKIYLGYKDLGKLKQKEIAKYISCVYQENEAPDDITVRDLVSFGRNIYSNVKKEDKEENKRMIDFALKATGIEEIQDKYRGKIKNIGEESNNVVWNYSIKDLKNIKNYLIDYKEKLLLEKKFENIHEKICQIKVYLKNNEVNDEENLMKIVNCIEEVNSKNLTLDEKYEKLKVYFELIKYFDRNIAIYILELITLVIQ